MLNRTKIRRSVRFSAVALCVSGQQDHFKELGVNFMQYSCYARYWRQIVMLLLVSLFPIAGYSAEPIKPIPEASDYDLQKAILGNRLFHEKKLSKNDTISCASCHDLSTGGDDGKPVSIGVEGREGNINSPTVFNAIYNFSQFWDGRAKTLDQQIDGPVQAEVEMGSVWPEVVAKLYEDESYTTAFKSIYADGITRENIKDAINEFEKTLVTPDSRFDKWLRGDTTAINKQELRGYQHFKNYGCTSCHQGANVGGNMFQVFGVLNSYFLERGNITDADMGRFNITGNKSDKHAFKVPSLRMAAHTAPYLHDGSAKTLRDAVDAMFRFQLGREAPDSHKDDIVKFIETLAGTYTEVAK